jgi:pSer/pThr/pTyr-binding forkhead associated (FHA) protein
MTAKAGFRIVVGDGRSVPVPDGDSLVVGRGDGAGLRFTEDRCVSPLHARFTAEGELLYLEDLGSVNGVFLRVREPVVLVHRDRLRLGDHVFSFEVIPDLEAARLNVTKVFTDPTTEIIGTVGGRARARLVTHLVDGHRGKEYSIGGRAIVLGHGRGTHNFMADPRIAPRHAMIAPQPDGGFILTDLDSATGTWRQTRERLAVAPGQELLIGRQHLEIAR